MNKEYSAHIYVKWAVAFICLAFPAITLSAEVIPIHGLQDWTRMQPETCMSFIIGALAIMTDQIKRMILYTGMIVGTGLLYVLNVDLPSLGTGICFVAWGCSVFFERERLGALVIAGVGLTAVTGYVFHVPELYGDISQVSSPMAITTALIMLIISVYLITKHKARAFE